MHSAEITIQHPMLAFEGIMHHASKLWSAQAIWCSAPACASAKAGYIISHQNRGWQ